MTERILGDENLGPDERTIESAARSFRIGVGMGEADAIRAVTRAWKVADKAIQERQETYLAKIAQAQANGTPITEAWLYQVARLDQLRAYTAAQYAQVAIATERQVNAAQVQAARGGITATQDLIEAMLGGYRVPMAVDFGTVDVEHQVNGLVGTLQRGSPLRDLTFSNLSVNGANSVAQALVEGVTAGLSIRDIRNRMALERNLTLARAQTIARTEILRAGRQASLDAMRSSGVVDRWRWSGTLDTNTCGLCTAMQGTIHLASEDFDTHPNCRCAPVPVTKSWAALGFPGVPETTVDIPWGDEIIARLDDAELRRRFGPGRAELLKGGYVQAKDLYGYYGEDRWGRRLRMRPLADLRTVAQANGWNPPAPKGTKPVAGTASIAQGASIDQLTAWAKTRWPQLSRVDLAGLDPDLTRRALTTLDDLDRQYPGVFDRCTTIRNRRPPEAQDAWAHTYLDAHELVLYHYAWSNPAKFQAELDSSMRVLPRIDGKAGVPFHVPGMNTPESVVQHEFGHMVEGWLRGHGTGTTRWRYEVSALASGMGGNWGQGTVGGIVDSILGTFGRSRNPISNYATRNTREKFAETWAAQFSPVTTEANREWVRRLKALTTWYGGVRTNPVSQPYHQGLVGQNEQEAARDRYHAELTSLAKLLGFRTWEDITK